jgi:hypothetical protein
VPIDESDLAALALHYRREVSLGVIREPDGSRVFRVIVGNERQVAVLDDAAVLQLYPNARKPPTLERVIHTHSQSLAPSNEDLLVAINNMRGTEIINVRPALAGNGGHAHITQRQAAQMIRQRAQLPADHADYLNFDALPVEVRGLVNRLLTP